MNNKATKVLAALAVFAVLLVPTFVTGVSEKDTPVLTEDEPVSTDESPKNGVVSDSDDIVIERVDPSEMAPILDQANIDRFGANLDYSQLETRDRSDNGAFEFSNPYVGTLLDQGYTLARDPYMGIKTRSSDDEQNTGHWDYFNGSVITSLPDTLSGTLDKASVPQNSDSIDWYKIEVTNVDPRAPGSFVNFTMQLNEYYASEGELFELKAELDENGDITGFEHNYFDMLGVTVLHHDYWYGRSHKGGYWFLYDDQDDDDSWYHDGDNDASVTNDWHNWTWNWRADLKSEGVRDMDGLGNGVSELNWYYIGISWNYLTAAGAPQRSDTFEITYEFEISSATDSDNVVPNDWKNATDEGNGGSVQGILTSHKDQNDWYSVQGNDMDKIWKMTFWANRSFPVSLDIPYWDFYTTIAYIDIWLSYTFLYTHWGADRTWGTDDDGYGGLTFTYSVFVNGGGFIGFNDQGQFITAVDGWIINNMTGGNSEQRKFYIGVSLEAAEWAVDSQGTIQGVYLPYFGVTQRYSLDVSIGEVPVNNRPEITNITVVSSNEQHEAGGNYDDEFDIFVTYQDEDNNPPNTIYIEIDPGYGNEPINISALSFENDKFDKDYTDADPKPGKVYKLTLTGEELGDDPEVHIIKAWAIDKLPEGSIQTARWSVPLFLEDVLKVWNDDPPELNKDFVGFDDIDEDSPTVSQSLDNYVDGIFTDNEGFTLFEVWNESIGDDGDWDDTYDTDLMHIEIVEEFNLWYAKITPKHNQHGTQTIRLKGYDEYMSIEGMWPVKVVEINDPPRVFHVEIDGTEYEVDNRDPLKPVAHLEDITVNEDEEFTFSIIAEDMDLEGEKDELEYNFERSLSDNWDTDVDVEWDTGVVTFIPTNNDAGENSLMVFSVDDGGEEDVKLYAYFEVENVNDEPQISISTTIGRSYTQFREISIKPIGSDPDSGDQLTYSVNMMQKIGTDDVESIETQLPFADLTEGVDWTMDENTGQFTFTISDQNIWKTNEGMEDQVQVTLRFQVEDKAGATATDDIILILINENEEPPKPEQIYYEITDEDPDTPGDQGLTVNFWVDTVEDPDGDKLRYRWDFGDGQTGEGINVNHTYAKEGPKNVQMWVEDEEFQTDRIAKRIELEAVEVDDGGGGGGGGGTQDPTGGGDETDNTWLIILIVAIVVILILVAIVGAIFMLRKKPAPEAQYGYGYDQQMLAAYGAQGLPPADTGALPGQQTQELPPQEAQGLPPAQGEFPQQPAAVPETQAPAEQTVESPAQEAPQGPAGSTCPSCGSPVDPSWFLCPNCKAPLQ